MQSAIKYLETGSHCPFSSVEFAQKTAGEVVSALGIYQASRMNINVYTPPYEETDFPDGFLRLLFFNDNLPWAQIGVEFGQTDETDTVVRFGFDRVAWEKDPDDPHSGGINAVNFDEAWRIVCLIGKSLQITEVSISYGY